MKLPHLRDLDGQLSLSPGYRLLSISHVVLQRTIPSSEPQQRPPVSLQDCSTTTMPLLAQYPKNRIILGLMTFGPDETAGARITSLAEYSKCLDYFQSQGYNEVDTARMYVGGQQESFTREARWKERGLKLATKCYPHEPGMHSRDQLKGFCNKSLSELGTDCVDIFYLHAPDRSVPFEETLEACNELHKEGKFIELGLSNYTAWEVAEIMVTCRKNDWVQPTVYQAMYNAISTPFRQNRRSLPLSHIYANMASSPIN